MFSLHVIVSFYILIKIFSASSKETTKLKYFITDEETTEKWSERNFTSTMRWFWELLSILKLTSHDISSSNMIRNSLR